MFNFNKSIVDALAEGVLITNSKGLIVKTNISLDKLFGYDENELINKKVELLIPKDLSVNHVTYREDYIRKPKTRPHGQGLDVFGLRKDKSTFPVEISLSYFDLNSEKFILCLVSDITIRKEKETNIQNFIVEQQELKSKYINSQLEILKKQISPHYLFNCLNILYSLIEKDQKRALLLCKKISETYSYVLETKNQNIIKLEQEISFLKNYIFLQKIRFPNFFRIKLDNSLILDDTYLVPLSLQLLIENAFKHNRISETNPLEIEIFQRDNRVCVRNNLNSKDHKELSFGMGLKNLKAQYKLLTDIDVIVKKELSSFLVCLPIINRK